MPHPSSLFLAPAMLLTVLLAGCGGGGSSGNDGAEPSQASPQAVAVPATVRLEGCVVTSSWMSVADAAVHVRTADGRAVGTAFTNSRGVFALTVPAHITIVLATTDAGPADATLDTGSGPLAQAACLQADV